MIQNSTRGMLARKFAHTVVAAFRLHKIVAGAQVTVTLPDADGGNAAAAGSHKQAGVVLKRRGRSAESTGGSRSSVMARNSRVTSIVWVLGGKLLNVRC